MTSHRSIVVIPAWALAFLVGALSSCRLIAPRPPVYEAFELPSGVQVQDVTIPIQDHLLFARIGDDLTLHYEARLADGSAIDSSWDRGEPIRFVLGAGEVPEGLEQGLVGMRQFARRRLTVPPELAYGEEGVEGLVPPDATVMFDVELMAVRRPQPEPDPEAAAPASDG